MALLTTADALVLSCAALGAAVGPTLAALTHTAPADGPMLTLRQLRGVPAGRRRIVVTGVVTAAVFAALAAAIGPSLALPAFLVMGALGVVLAVVDAEHHRLPDRLVLPGYVIGEALLLVAAVETEEFEPWLRALGAAAAVFGVLFLLALISPEGLGFGDVKLGGLLGMHLGWLGWGYAVLGVAAGFLVGAVAAALLLAARRTTLRTPVAFGPALLAGALLAVLTGPVLLSAYGG